MTNPYRIQNIVMNVLMDNKDARNSDYTLWVEVCKVVQDITGCNILDRKFGDAMLNRDEYRVPNLESIGRVRRKLQEDYPELRADKTVEMGRSALNDAFKEYSRS